MSLTGRSCGLSPISTPVTECSEPSLHKLETSLICHKAAHPFSFCSSRLWKEYCTLWCIHYCGLCLLHLAHTVPYTQSTHHVICIYYAVCNVHTLYTVLHTHLLHAVLYIYIQCIMLYTSYMLCMHTTHGAINTLSTCCTIYTYYTLRCVHLLHLCYIH